MLCSIYSADALLSSQSVKTERRDRDVRRDKASLDSEQRRDRMKSYFEKPADVSYVHCCCLDDIGSL